MEILGLEQTIVFLFQGLECKEERYLSCNTVILRQIYLQGILILWV